MIAVAESVLPALSTLEIDVTYDPTAVLQERFRFMVAGNQQNHAPITPPPPESSVIVQVTLTGGTFAVPPIFWAVPPSPDSTVVTLDGASQTISFQVPKPTSYFSPWAFRININDTTDAINGIRSPLFYLIRELNPDDPETITYSPVDGSFTVRDSLELANEIVLVNPVVHAVEAISIPILLTGATLGNAARVGLPSTPIDWISGQEPSWIAVEVTDSTHLSLVIQPNASGQGAGFRLAVQVSETQQVLSPDPILINATLGDGG